MTDNASFTHGGTTFPLDDSSSYSLLHDADKAVFYGLEFYKSVLETHLSERWLVEVAASSSEQITSIVAETLPLNPEAFLSEAHIKFPLLALYRKSSAFRYLGHRKLSVDDLECVYVLPPMQAAEAERLLPILKAVAAVIDYRTEIGFDPSYTPSSPTGTAGEPVWTATRAGLARVEVMSGVQYGGYAPSPDVFFPAVIIPIRMEERSDPLLSELATFNGLDAAIDLPKDDETSLEALDVVDIETHVAPTLTSLSPTSGSHNGNVAVTLTGTDFRVGTTPRVLFDGADASSVIVVSNSSITCLTPAVAAGVVDVDIIAVDGQSDTLEDAFTFT